MNVHGVKMIPTGCRVCHHYETDGTFEPESVQVWRDALRAGQIAIDAGSYTGLYALLAAQAGSIALAFEPNPVVFRRLQENIAKNASKAKAYTQALSDKPERRAFWTRHDMTSAGRFKEREGANRSEVDCITIASLVAVGKHKVCAIKIDVEGAELAVLRGAQSILCRDRPVVIAEALTDARRRSIVLYMAGLGYDWREADGRNLVFTCARN